MRKYGWALERNKIAHIYEPQTHRNMDFIVKCVSAIYFSQSQPHSNIHTALILW